MQHHTSRMEPPIATAKGDVRLAPSPSTRRSISARALKTSSVTLYGDGGGKGLGGGIGDGGGGVGGGGPGGGGAGGGGLGACSIAAGAKDGISATGLGGPGGMGGCGAGLRSSARHVAARAA